MWCRQLVLEVCITKSLLLTTTCKDFVATEGGGGGGGGGHHPSRNNKGPDGKTKRGTKHRGGRVVQIDRLKHMLETLSTN